MCEKPRVKCSRCPHQHFLPVTDDVIRSHLEGRGDQGKDCVIGVNPMLQDETCLFLVVDFDEDGQQQDAEAFLETCREFDLPAAVERSRSGQGAHIWLFFEEAIPARPARSLGTFILKETMERQPGIGLDSYDRLFPKQDALLKGGYGNLNALTLQKGPRERGNSVVVDNQFVPYSDQWSFLAKDLGKRLEDVIDAILLALQHRIH